MDSEAIKRLQKLEGEVVRLTSTEGEAMIAKVLSVSEEYQDVIVSVLSTNQPERYERLGKKYDEAAWAIPFEYVRDVQPHAGSAAQGGDLRDD